MDVMGLQVVMVVSRHQVVMLKFRSTWLDDWGSRGSLLGKTPFSWGFNQAKLDS
jgi:hypothetical protein